jgi:hypothetical protein
MRKVRKVALVPLVIWAQLAFVVLLVLPGEWTDKSTPSIVLEIPKSAVASDIESVLHLPEQSMIVINLNKQRNCSQPQLIGRLSGPCLAKLVWVETQDQQNAIVGHYRLVAARQK